jgi:hypothetical protein
MSRVLPFDERECAPRESIGVLSDASASSAAGVSPMVRDTLPTTANHAEGEWAGEDLNLRPTDYESIAPAGEAHQRLNPGVSWAPQAAYTRLPGGVSARLSPGRAQDGYPLPTNGIFVAMTVRNWTLASSGRPAM